MENDIQTKLDTQNAKLDAIFVSVEKTRKYFQFIMWATVITVLLPLIGLVIGIPIFLNSYMGQFQGLI